MATRISTQLLDSITEESIYPVITPQFEEKPSTFNYFMKGEAEDVNSRGTRIPAYLIPSASNGWGAEGGKLPLPVADEDAAMRLRYARYRRAIEISWDALREMEKKGILLKGVMARVTRHSNSAFKSLNRSMFGTGDGTVAIPLSVSSTTVTYAATTAGGYTHGSRKILKNGRYQHIDSTGAILSGGMSGTVSTSTAVSRNGNTTGTATFDQVPNDLTTAIGVGTCRLVYENSYNREIRGFGYHFSNGNEIYQTLSRSDFPDLRATIVAAGGVEITVALFLLLDQEMKFRVEDVEELGEPAYIMNPTQVYGYELLGHSLKRAQMSEKTLDLGYNKREYNGRTFIEDVDCDYDKIFKCYKNSFKKFENRPFGPMKEGSGFWRDVPSFTVGSEDTGSHMERVRGYIGWDGELGCVQPSALGAITGLGFQDMGRSY